MITRAIEKAFEVRRKRFWTKTYWAFDVHDTILVPNYSPDQIPTEFFPHAKETLQLISSKRDIVMILFTSSSPEDCSEYINFFKGHSIIFDYANENPEVRSASYGCYEIKPYFNVLFDDKAGFDPISDWMTIKQFLEHKHDQIQ